MILTLIVVMIIIFVFGKKFLSIWIMRKLKKISFNVTDCYISGDLDWAICFDVFSKRIAFFKIRQHRVDLYHITHIKNVELKNIEGVTKRGISISNTLLGALAGRIIGGKKASSVLTGAVIGAATSPSLWNNPRVYVAQVHLFVKTTHSSYRINFKPITSRRTNNANISEAIKWHKLIDPLP